MAENITQKAAASWRRLLPKLRGQRRTRHQGPVTALEMEGAELHIVQTALRHNHPVVTRLAVETLQLPPSANQPSPEVIGQAVADTLRRLDIRAHSVLMAVPRACVVMRTLLVPVIDDVREIASMVHFQIAKDLPFRIDEAVIDFKVSRRVAASSRSEGNGRNGGNGVEAKADSGNGQMKLEVLVAAAQREIVEHYQRVSSAAGLKLAALGWVSYANARCLEACRVTETSEAVGLISLRLDEIGIDIVAQQTLLFSRGAKIKADQNLPQSSESPDGAPNENGSPGAPENGAPVDDFVEMATIEVVRSLHSYGGIDPHGPVAKLVVTGATGHEAAVIEALQARLSMPCAFLDSVGALGLADISKDAAARSVSALGLAFGAHDPEGLPLDFLNPKRPAVPRNLRRIKWLASAAAAAVLFVALLATRAHLINKRLEVQNQIQAELTEAEKKRPIYRQMRQQATTLQDWSKAGRDNLEHYALLSSVLPGTDDIYVTSLSMSGHGSIRFAVQARSSEILARLDQQLRAAGYDVKPLAVTPGSDKFGYNFRTAVELMAPAKMKVALTNLAAPKRPEDDGSLDVGAKAPRRGGSS